jgi:hypothetical protein
VLDPRRIGKQNSGFSDDDISDILCLLVPYSRPARDLVEQLADEGCEFIVGPEAADIIEPEYRVEDHASRFQLAPPSGRNHAIILRLSAQTKNPLLGFTFGRNLARCDVHFPYDPVKRVSNVHFRIYVNEYGIVMLEDQSTNGTIVDTDLIGGRERADRSRTVLQSGAKIGILLSYENQSLDFIVRIPRREGLYDKAYTIKVKEYFQRLRALGSEAATTVETDLDGPVNAHGPRSPLKASADIPPSQISLLLHASLDRHLGG